MNEGKERVRKQYDYSKFDEGYFDSMSTPELIFLARQLNSDLCEGKRKWVLRIPVSNGCPDIILGAVIDRLEKMMSGQPATKDGEIS